MQSNTDLETAIFCQKLISSETIRSLLNWK